MALYDSLTYMLQSQNIVWLGGTGVGKTGLATSFLIHAINQGYSAVTSCLANCSPSSTDPVPIIPKPNC
jgi:DNA replication protein DnaC